MKDKVREARLLKAAQLIRKNNHFTVLDLASDGGVLKDYLPEVIGYYEANYPEYNLEKEMTYPTRMQCVCALEVIEHLRNPRTLMKTANNCLIPGGTFLLSTQNSAYIKNRISLLLGKTPICFFGPSYLEVLYDPDYHKNSRSKKKDLELSLHVRCYTYSELERMLNLEGFICKRHDVSANPLILALPPDFRANLFIEATKVSG